jgi:hypothetical protein
VEGQRDEGPGPVSVDLAYPACWTWPLPDERPATLEAVYDWQDGRCAVCGSTKRRMVEDHDHETSWIRGQLCRSCNALEGHAGLDSEKFERYRLVNPASIFGVEEAYVDMFGMEARPVAPVDLAVQARMAERLSLLLSAEPGEPFKPGPPVDRLSVACPYCEAVPGQPCRVFDRYETRTAGRELKEPHTRRWPPREYVPERITTGVYSHLRDGSIVRQLKIGEVVLDLDDKDRLLGIQTAAGAQIASLLAALVVARFPQRTDGAS